ncbi:hypothetical protein [Oryzicola mucosus]|uniref:Uncharacterized protein n=1 Tax=Oryzicola mucosus TaxID=2767425 RepID=A0A8J6PQV8_9HYPH|nr:hypothetical protein [Oryzicola mucosus]MBD0416520.1 hypothetical protein [Oryzicola mucosus]
MPMADPFGTASHQAQKVKDTLLEIQSAAYNSASTYTTVIIFGAYAGLFTIWGNTRDFLSQFATLSVALLLGTSAFFFVLFEVFKMLIVSANQLKIRKMLIEPLPAEEFLRRHAEIAKDTNTLVQRVVMPVWIVTLVITIICGFGAALILFGAVLRNLIDPLTP